MVRKLVHSNFFAGCHQLLPLTVLTAGLVLPLAMQASVRAEQLTGGRSAFDRAPLLVRTASSFQQANTSSTYQFTLEVPANAGAPLKAVRIVQDPNIGTVNFNMSQVQAFRGDSFAGGPAVTLANVGGEKPANANEVTVVFDPPIPPGETVTVSLGVDRNPYPGGVYLFGVTAFPPGENSTGLFLGYGRVSIYDNTQ